MTKQDTKKLVVVVSAAEPGKNVHEVDIERGTTAADVLDALGLRGYMLSPEGAATQIPLNQPLWGILQDGDKLRATANAELGVGLYSRMRRMLRDAFSGVRQANRALPATATLRRRIGHTRRRITPNSAPLHKIRRWKGWGKVMAGQYLAGSKAFAGEVRKEGKQHEFYIFNPPAAIFKSRHGACYRDRGKGWYWIHFNIRKDIDGGILAIENHLAEVLGS